MKEISYSLCSPINEKERDVENKKRIYENILFLIYQVQRSHCFICKYTSDTELSNFGNSNHCPNCNKNFVAKFKHANKTIHQIEILDNLRKKYIHNLRKQGYDMENPQIFCWEIELCEAMIVLSAVTSETGKPDQQYINLHNQIIDKYKKGNSNKENMWQKIYLRFCYLWQRLLVLFHRGRHDP